MHNSTMDIHETAEKKVFLTMDPANQKRAYDEYLLSERRNHMSKRKKKSSKRNSKTKSKKEKKDVLPRIDGEKLSERKVFNGKNESGAPSSMVALPRIRNEQERTKSESYSVITKVASKDLDRVVLPRLKETKDGFVRKQELKTSSKKMTSSNDSVAPRKVKTSSLNVSTKTSQPSKRIKNKNTIMVKITINGKEAVRKLPRASDSVSSAVFETENLEPGLSRVERGVKDTNPVRVEWQEEASDERIEEHKQEDMSLVFVNEEKEESALKKDEKIVTEPALNLDGSQEVVFEEIKESGTDICPTHRRRRKNKPKEKQPHYKSKLTPSTEREISDVGLSEAPTNQKQFLTTKEFIVEGLDIVNHGNKTHRKPKALAVTIRKPKVSRRRENGENYGIHGCKLLGNALDLDEYVIAMVRLYNCHDDVTLARVEEYPRELCQGS